MEVMLHEKGTSKVAVIHSPEVLLSTVQDALDLMASIHYQYGCDKAVLPKSAISEDFFNLRTGLAGAILQKFTNYQFKIAIAGDFSGYSSKSLRDFIYESNNGRQVFFLPTEEECVTRLHGV